MALTTKIMRSLEGADMRRLTVELTGSLDTATAPELEKELYPLLGTAPHLVLFDLEHLTFISSAGLRVISTTRKKVKESGGQVSVVRAQPQIQAVFEVIKALPGMTIFASIAEMDEYLAARQKAVLNSQD